MEEEHSCSTWVSNNIIKENHISTKLTTFITDPYVLFQRCYPIDYQDQNMVKKKTKQGKKKSWKLFMSVFSSVFVPASPARGVLTQWCADVPARMGYSFVFLCPSVRRFPCLHWHPEPQNYRGKQPWRTFSVCREQPAAHREMVTFCVPRPRRCFARRKIHNNNNTSGWI